MCALYIALRCCWRSEDLRRCAWALRPCIVALLSEGSEWVNERPGSTDPVDERPTSGPSRLGGFRPCERDSSEGLSLTATLIRCEAINPRTPAQSVISYDILIRRNVQGARSCN